jgi:hypothetical protein
MSTRKPAPAPVALNEDDTPDAADGSIEPEDRPDQEPGDPVNPPSPSRPAGPADERTRLLWNIWRSSTDRDAPTLLQLVNGGRIRRVDVDAVAGYVAVVTDEDTHRAIGVRREWVAALVGMFTRRTADEVAALLARGPAKIAPLPAPEKD